MDETTIRITTQEAPTIQGTIVTVDMLVGVLPLYTEELE